MGGKGHYTENRHSAQAGIEGGLSQIVIAKLTDILI